MIVQEKAVLGGGMCGIDGWTEKQTKIKLVTRIFGKDFYDKLVSLVLHSIAQHQARIWGQPEKRCCAEMTSCF